jgi:hypothetical protein
MKKCLLVLMTFFALNSYAGLLLEPVVGISLLGNVTTGSGEYDMNTVPVTWGARIGYSFLGIMGGIDYQVTNGVEFDVPSSTSADTNDVQKNAEYDVKETGVFIGYDFPILVRGWMGYILSSKMESSTVASYEDGGGYKYGIGLTALPFISVNFESKVLNYDTAIRNGVSTGVNVKNKFYTLSVSLPLDL